MRMLNNIKKLTVLGLSLISFASCGSSKSEQVRAFEKKFDVTVNQKVLREVETFTEVYGKNKGNYFAVLSAKENSWTGEIREAMRDLAEEHASLGCTGLENSGMQKEDGMVYLHNNKNNKPCMFGYYWVNNPMIDAVIITSMVNLEFSKEGFGDEVMNIVVDYIKNN